jgi:hypothetical protein
VRLDDLFGAIFAGAIAGVFICGAYRRWQWLVDPNLAAWPIYSQSFIKKFFGKKAVVYFTYFCGLVGLAVSAAFLCAAFTSR